jgi:hypothetical protein
MKRSMIFQAEKIWTKIGIEKQCSAISAADSVSYLCGCFTWLGLIGWWPRWYKGRALEIQRYLGYLPSIDFWPLKLLLVSSRHLTELLHKVSKKLTNLRLYVTKVHAPSQSWAFSLALTWPTF